MRPINFDPRAFQPKRSTRALVRNVARIPSPFAWTVAKVAAFGFVLALVVIL